MKHFERWLIGTVTVLVGAACVSTEKARVVPEPEPEAVAPEAGTPEPVEPEAGDAAVHPPGALADALDHAIDHGWQELYLMSECHQEIGFLHVEVFSSGVGIWNRRRQFTLSESQLRSILESFRAADFASMPDVFGKGSRKAPPRWQEALDKARGGARAATKINCRVSLRLDGELKQVAQTTKGEPSVPFRRLADEIFETCREPASAGIAADDLNDGLTQVAEGSLAPEVLRLTMNRKPHRDATVDGWLLDLRGPEVTTRSFVPRQGYGDPIRLSLDAEAFTRLARTLAEQDLADLPVNLWAEHYTTVKLEVLGRKSQVEARRFDGMEPQQHGELQQRFDRVVDELARLHRRVLADGEQHDRAVIP